MSEDITIKDGRVLDARTGEQYAEFDGTLTISCDHPEHLVEYGDDDERGVCPICGATCDWTWELDVVNEGHDEDGEYYCQTGQVRVPTEWHEPKKPGGVIGEYIHIKKGVL